jgi:hypothetical protein
VAGSNALVAARKALSSRINDPKVKFVPGLADDLRAILAAFDECDRRTSVLAAVALKKHFWPDAGLSKEHFAVLEEMGAEPATVSRVGKHGKDCLCEQCMKG